MGWSPTVMRQACRSTSSDRATILIVHYCRSPRRRDFAITLCGRRRTAAPTHTFQSYSMIAHPEFSQSRLLRAPLAGPQCGCPARQIYCQLGACVSRLREILAGYRYAFGGDNSNPAWFCAGSLDCGHVLAIDLGGSALTGVRERCADLCMRSDGERHPVDRGIDLSLLYRESASPSAFNQSAIEMSAMLVFQAVGNQPINPYHWLGLVGLQFAPFEPDIADCATRRFAKSSA